MNKAIVFKIEELQPIPKADKLQLCNFNGVPIIVSKDYKLDTLCLYFPVGTRISQKFLSEHNLFRHSELNVDTSKTGFFGDNGKVESLKLRGVTSLGFIYVPTLQEIEDNKLEKLLGQEIDEFNGEKEFVTKFVSKAEAEFIASNNSKKQGKPKVSVSKFFEKLQNTPNVAEVLSVFKPGDKIVITNKMHGTSGRTGKLPVTTRWNWKELLKLNFKKFVEKTEYKLMTGSRNLDIIVGDTTLQKTEKYRIDIHDTLKYLYDGYTLYYEIVGYSSENSLIQSVGDQQFTYGCKPGEYEIFVYKIAKTSLDGEVTILSYDDMVDFLMMNCPYIRPVPIITRHTFETKERLLGILKHLDLTYGDYDFTDSRHIGEGVVLRVDEPNSWRVSKYKFVRFCHMENIQSTEDKVNIETVS